MKRTITIFGARADAGTQRADESNKQVTLKKRTPLTNFISQINITPVENEKYLDIVMLMYNLAECFKCYAKTSDILW